MKVEVCFGSYCQAAGARCLAEELEHQGVRFETTGCRSLCPHAPVLVVDQRARLKVSVSDIAKLKR